MRGDYVRVEAQVFIVCIFIASVPLMAYSFNCQMGVVDFVYKVKDSQGGQGDEDKNNSWKDGSDDLNLLGV